MKHLHLMILADEPQSAVAAQTAGIDRIFMTWNISERRQDRLAAMQCFRIMISI